MERVIPNSKDALRVIQNLDSWPICDSDGCASIGVALYADKENVSYSLCGKHQRELRETGVISTCDAKPLQAWSAICTLASGHVGHHQYKVDGRSSQEWVISA